jgi:hypothetical protein
MLSVMSYSRSDEGNRLPQGTRPRSGGRGNIPLGYHRLEDAGSKDAQPSVYSWLESLVCGPAAAREYQHELTPARRILFFPYGNNCDCVSLYLEHGFEDKPQEDWYQCVQFGLVLWNPNDPTTLVTHRKLPSSEYLYKKLFLIYDFRCTPPIHF